MFTHSRRLPRFAWLAASMLLALVTAPCTLPAAEEAPKRVAVLLEIDGAIGPATAGYIHSGLQSAAGRGAALVILRMNTPGGLDTSMRAIILDILASPVPVATYVNPSGARAASAGTYILYASHLAAMTPGTNVGAATPITIGLGGSPDQEKSQQQSPSEAKMVNDAVAYLRSLASLRNRNADWAERAVRDAASLSADAALEQKVIDVRAVSVEDLLTQADGRPVTIGGHTVRLETRGLTVEAITPDLRTRILSAATNPNVALVLVMIGLYGLIFEFMSPGALLPGIAGAICLLLGLYAFAALPLNIAGVALLLLGVALMIAEIHSPSWAILGSSGALAFILGAAMLTDTNSPDFRLNWQVIAGLAVVSLTLVVLAGRAALNNRRQRIVSGREQMIGERGTIQDWNGEHGHVFVHGERWNATSREPLHPGLAVRVVDLKGLRLEVEPDETAAARRTD